MADGVAAWGIDKLDGEVCSLIAHRMGRWEVMVGGGPDFFVLTATTDAGARVANALTAVEPDDDADTVDLTVGSQSVDYPREYALTRDEVFVAITDLEVARFPDKRWEIVG